MAKRLTGFINLTKCNVKEKLFTTKKGEKGVNVPVWINDTPDQYGNIASVQLQTAKDEPKVYIGNLKEPEPQQRQEPTGDTSGEVPPAGDDLPF